MRRGTGGRTSGRSHRAPHPRPPQAPNSAGPEELTPPPPPPPPRGQQVTVDSRESRPPGIVECRRLAHASPAATPPSTMPTPERSRLCHDFAISCSRIGHRRPLSGTVHAHGGRPWSAQETATVLG